ncbi:hypothetical protein J5N97_014870 [Dioscorea zingiberensis]|uniref:Uncharacterized protein n=1 Tax=Dioscorea zingiberensis TaxID=325984 RepID=A0A9D5HK44_9LILI|nr:hypothetical protein J5N97_014870 [Dioscorea zingiberensis]
MCRYMTEITERMTPPRLRIHAFFLCLLIGDKLAASRPFSESLTLVYLSRIDGNKLEVNVVKVRAEKSEFLALHRVRLAKRIPVKVVFVSTDRVLVSDSIHIKTLLGDDKLLKRVFQRCKGEWKMERRGREEGDVAGVAAVEIRVARENGAMMTEVGLGCRSAQLGLWAGQAYPPKSASDKEGDTTSIENEPRVVGAVPPGAFKPRSNEVEKQQSLNAYETLDACGAWGGG